MPTTNRPFFLNFFAAFRAHPSYQTKPTSTSSQSTQLSAANSRSLTTKANPPPSTQTANPAAIPNSSTGSAYVAAQATASYHNARAQTTSPSQRSQSTSPLPRSPPSHAGVSSPAAGAFARSRTPSQTRPAPGTPLFANHRQQRRSSDSSGSDASSGIGGQNWYIGGRTAQGEERFYKLGVVKRYNSADRMSLDRLSL
ncbi:MAG: hypothetical protein M1828_003560 [Chrysothrix sp. TS-e1954]|nr:MAG: hypothetical protein M1828_003560 [Chrysothrix sp. TS-e1954]